MVVIGHIENDSAPKIAHLTECNAPELPEWKARAFVDTILHSIFSVEYSPKVERYILKFLRKIEIAIVEYRLGRRVLQSAVATTPKTDHHFLETLRALSHFEQSAVALYQAAQLTRPLIRKRQLFEPNDKSSPLYKLNKIYNRSRHFEGEETPGRIPAAPVWLTNAGLETPECTLRFVEMHEVILSLTNVAKLVAEEFPSRVLALRKEAD